MDYRKILFKSIRYTGAPFLIRETIQKKKVTIVLFHDIDLIKTEIHFRVLNEKYNIISLKEYFDAIENSSFKLLPPKSLIITVDDGLKNNYLLKSLLKEYNIPVTIFLCAGIVGTNKHFWFRHGLARHTIEKLKHLPNAQRLDFLKKYGYTDEKEFSDCQALSQAEIEDLINIIDFQSHTISHPILPKCTDEEAYKEITLSKKILEEHYNLEVYALSYPNGDYGEREILFAKKAGYRYGITLDAGYNDSKTDPFKLKRLSIRDGSDVDELIVKASGLWMYIRNSIKRVTFSKLRHNVGSNYVNILLLCLQNITILSNSDDP